MWSWAALAERDGDVESARADDRFRVRTQREALANSARAFQVWVRWGVAERDRRSSCGSLDVFFKIVFGQNFRVAVLQNIIQFRDDANDLFAIKFGTNPNDETRYAIHTMASKKVDVDAVKIGGESLQGKEILNRYEFNPISS